MNRAEILSMEAGRELDMLIATQIMEWTDIRAMAAEEDLWGIVPGTRLLIGKGTLADDENWIEVSEMVPDYSTNITAAWMVMKKMMGMDHVVGFHVEWLPHMNPQPCASFQHNPKGTKSNILFWHYAETVPLAVCHAALLAILEGE